MTFHSGANTTSYITGNGTGDHTHDEDGFAYEYTTASWFFIDALDVMASSTRSSSARSATPSTDGTHTTFKRLRPLVERALASIAQCIWKQGQRRE